ncbi:MAG: hypothetical protein CSA09_04370 [Candidatus Contendobacter odensis]|uniref:Serine aminopeptidase S33 domain-containing protein n=1 Tax=Candidatus Contendibacter odensensis TaxID=1400860 RepID=A0A2G6PEG0_9GAMM|nr:MAG: hypothetical protein CSA09_04370 [Candidatus Contendobacter odensis]
MDNVRLRYRLAVLLAVFVMVGAGVMIFSGTAEKMVYYPQPLTPAAGAAILVRHPQIKEVSLITADGFRLHGWRVPGIGQRPRPLVIYFGGNADEVSWMIDFAEVFTGWDLLLVNYRGYGLSTGTPSQEALFQDALKLYDHFTTQSGIDAARVIILGRSLGSGVATYLASQRSVQGVLLITPFDSITEVACDFYPFLPVRAVLGDLFNSAARAPGITTPVRMIIAADDKVVTTERSQKLFDAWGGPKEWVMLTGVGHNDLHVRHDFWEAIREFLGRYRYPP